MSEDQRRDELVAERAASRRRIGKRIKALRERLGMRPSALARLVGVKHPSLCAWESGKAAPSHAHMPAIAKALGVTVDALYGKKAA